MNVLQEVDVYQLPSFRSVMNLWRQKMIMTKAKHEELTLELRHQNTELQRQVSNLEIQLGNLRVKCDQEETKREEAELRIKILAQNLEKIVSNLKGE